MRFVLQGREPGGMWRVYLRRDARADILVSRDKYPTDITRAEGWEWCCEDTITGEVFAYGK